MPVVKKFNSLEIDGKEDVARAKSNEKINSNAKSADDIWLLESKYKKLYNNKKRIDIEKISIKIALKFVEPSIKSTKNATINSEPEGT